jgi:putative SOS response-associated peptidase YedK
MHARPQIRDILIAQKLRRWSLIAQHPFVDLTCPPARARRKQFVEEHFDTVSGDEDWNPRYNIAPTQPVPVIRQNPKQPVRELSLMRWGLIPSWANRPS